MCTESILGEEAFIPGFVQPPFYLLASLRVGSLGQAGLGCSLLAASGTLHAAANWWQLTELTVPVASFSGRAVGTLAGPLSPMPWGFLAWCLGTATWRETPEAPSPPPAVAKASPDVSQDARGREELAPVEEGSAVT